MCASLLLREILRVVARRYRLPALAALSDGSSIPLPATALAIVIEQARCAISRGEAPTVSMKQAFIEGLARLIEEALHDESGDPVFKATLFGTAWRKCVNTCRYRRTRSRIVDPFAPVSTPSLIPANSARRRMRIARGWRNCTLMRHRLTFPALPISRNTC